MHNSSIDSLSVLPSPHHPHPWLPSTSILGSVEMEAEGVNHESMMQTSSEDDFDEDCPSSSTAASSPDTDATGESSNTDATGVSSDMDATGESSDSEAESRREAIVHGKYASPALSPAPGETNSEAECPQPLPSVDRPSWQAGHLRASRAARRRISHIVSTLSGSVSWAGSDQNAPEDAPQCQPPC